MIGRNLFNLLVLECMHRCASTNILIKPVCIHLVYGVVQECGVEFVCVRIGIEISSVCFAANRLLFVLLLTRIILLSFFC